MDVLFPTIRTRNGKSFVHLFAMALETFLVPFCLSHNYNLLYTGPYALIGAVFYLFHRYSARITPTFFSILGFNFSIKLFHYIWFLQVAGSAGTSSALIIAIGWTAALLYHKLPILQSIFDAPDSIAKVVETHRQWSTSKWYSFAGTRRWCCPARCSSCHGGCSSHRGTTSSS